MAGNFLPELNRSGRMQELGFQGKSTGPKYVSQTIDLTDVVAEYRRLLSPETQKRLKELGK